MPFADHRLAKQRRHRHVMDAPERPQSEGERGQQAIDQRQRQLIRMQRRHHRQRQQFAEQADDQIRQRGAGGEPDQRSDTCEHDHLGEIDREDVAAGGADGLEGRDDVAAAIDMAFHGIGDADAADQQRGEADQREELREAADGALQLRRGVAAGADFPPRSRQRLSRVAGQRLRGAVVGRVVREFYAIDPAHQAAGLQQLGRAQAGFADQEARPKTDAAGELVGLGADHAADLEAGAADADAVADLQVEPRQQASRRRRRRMRRPAWPSKSGTGMFGSSVTSPSNG